MILDIRHFKSGEIPKNVVEDLLISSERDKDVQFKVRDPGEGYSRCNLEYVLKESPVCKNYIAFLDENPIGCVSFHSGENLLGEKGGELDFLYMNSEYRNLGIGTVLSIYAMRTMKKDGANEISVELGNPSSDTPVSKILGKVLNNKKGSGYHVSGTI
jgi:GNAT superfamily N-acetyltransferase